jgi:DNA-binding transcriptional LysR family regulator
MDTVMFTTFLEVARCGSFTKTAERLGYAQSSVTAHIQKLEQLYGVVLFERFGKKMRLTTAGQELRGYVERMMTLFEESKRRMSCQTEGSLTIGTIESLIAFFLPPTIRSFRHTFERVRLNIHPSAEPAIIDGVRSGSLDLGIILDRPCETEDLITVPIRREPLVLVASPDHPLGRSDELILHADMEELAVIATEERCTYRSAFEKALKEEHVRYQIHYELGSIEAIKQCVGLGLGVALLPKITVQDELDRGILHSVAFAYPDIDFYTQIIYHSKKWLSPPLQHMLTLLQNAGKPASQ